MPVPARQGVAQTVVVPPRRVHVGRRTRPPAEVLVAAADGEVDAGLVERHRHHPGGVAQVPQRERARLVRGRREPRQVEQLTGAVVEMRQRDQGHLTSEAGQDPRDVARRRGHDLELAGLGGRTEDVQVRREGPGSVTTTRRPGRSQAAAR